MIDLSSVDRQLYYKVTFWILQLKDKNGKTIKNMTICYFIKIHVEYRGTEGWKLKSRERCVMQIVTKRELVTLH